MAKKNETGNTTTKTTAASKATKPATKRPVRARASKAARVPNVVASTPDAATPAPDKPAVSSTSQMTCLDAAYAVLTRLNKPMRTKAIMEQMVDRELWTSPGGSTPDATLTAAIIRDIAKRGEASRFKRGDRGYYAARHQKYTPIMTGSQSARLCTGRFLRRRDQRLRGRPSQRDIERVPSIHIARCRSHSISAAIGRICRSEIESLPSTTRGRCRIASWISGARWSRFMI